MASAEPVPVGEITRRSPATMPTSSIIRAGDIERRMVVDIGEPFGNAFEA
jgi:hypothetical protein